MISKTYCVHPFISSSLQSDNIVLPCCQFMNEAPFKKIIPINQVRNGEFMNDMRSRMLNGEVVEGCQCFEEEAAGITATKRIHGNTKYEFTKDTKLRRLELNLDNVCNLKCRSCGSPYSHLIFDDELALYGTTLSEKKYSKNTMYDDVDVEFLEEIEVFGGEPMLSPNTSAFFKKLKDNNKFQDLSIILSTNCTIEPIDVILDGLIECKSLDINLSIDAYGKLNDYVRHGSNFEIIVRNMDFYKNLRLLRKEKHTQIRVHSVISVYTVNEIDLLNQFVKEKFPEFEKSYQVMQYPTWMNIKNTNKEFKDQVRSKILDENIISYLDSDGEDLIPHLINFTNELDEMRNETIPNEFLKTFLNSYSNRTSLVESKIFFNNYINQIKSNPN